MTSSCTMTYSRSCARWTIWACLSQIRIVCATWICTLAMSWSNPILRTPFKSRVYLTGTMRWSHPSSSIVSLLAGYGATTRTPIPRIACFPGHMNWREPITHHRHTSNRSSSVSSMNMLGPNTYHWRTTNLHDSLEEYTESQHLDLERVGSIRRRREP